MVDAVSLKPSVFPNQIEQVEKKYKILGMEDKDIHLSEYIKNLPSIHCCDDGCSSECCDTCPSAPG